MLNHIVLMGRLTRDPELRHTGNGTAVASFSLAVDRDYKGQSGEKETDFVDIVAWRSTADFVSKFFTKGRMTVVEAACSSGTGPTRTAASGAPPRWWRSMCILAIASSVSNRTQRPHRLRQGTSGRSRRMRKENCRFERSRTRKCAA